MILFIWNFKYALPLQMTKTVYFRYVRHTLLLFMLLTVPNPIFISEDCWNRLNNVEIFSHFVRFISSMESLSKV